MRAVTDTGPTEKNSRISEPIKNLFTLMEVVSTHDTVKHFKDQYKDCTIRYGEMKKQLAEDIIKFTTPIRERIHEIESNEAYLSRVVRMGAEKAIASASGTLKEVKEIIGIKKF
jgi:tryptophanyl-tRNA synthetase